MEYFGVYINLSLLFLIFNLFYLVLKTNKRNMDAVIILINSLFSVIISNLSVWKEGVYVDQYNLNGSSVSFYLNIVNMIIFIIIVAFCLRKMNKKEKNNS